MINGLTRISKELKKVSSSLKSEKKCRSFPDVMNQKIDEKEQDPLTPSGLCNLLTDEKEKKEQDPLVPSGLYSLLTGDLPFKEGELPLVRGSLLSVSESNFCKQFAQTLTDYIYTEVEKGVSMTTLTLQTADPFSKLNHLEVTIKHYDTDPQSFTLDFKSKGETSSLITDHLIPLKIALKEKLPHFVIHFSPPSYLFITEKTLKRSKLNKRREGRKSQVVAISPPSTTT